MTFYSKLKNLWEQRGFRSLRQFSAACGISYTTIISWKDKAADEIKIGSLQKISSALDVGLDYWDDVNAPDPTDVILSFHEIQVMLRYREVSKDKQEAVDAILGLER